MEDCLFCRIVRGEEPSDPVWENDDHVAFLDVNPNVEGMTLVIPKAHFASYAFDMPERAYGRLMEASREVARILESGLGVKRVAMVMEGTGIDHAHIKLYPLHGLKAKFVEMWAKDRVRFETYEGYITTQLGPRASPDALAAVARRIAAR